MKWVVCTEPKWENWYQQKCEVETWPPNAYGAISVRHPNGVLGSLLEGEFVPAEAFCGNCEEAFLENDDYLCPECRGS